MKVKIKRLLGSVVIGIFMLSLFGCNAVDENQAQTVEELLEERYGIEFEVSAIGNRYGNGESFKLEAIANPLNNKNINFNVFLKKDGESVVDNFMARLISSKINKVLKEELNKIGVESESFILTNDKYLSVDITDPNIEIADYVEQVGTEYFICYTIVKESENMDPLSFESALKTIFEYTANTKFNMNINVYPEESYDKLVKKFISLSSFGSSALNDFESIDEYKLVYDQEGFHNNRE
ncbi:hypothetical protein [Lysinibacillus halotolerans]|uniref:Lipoprotein n=1 Tax=Lysinibacillus halotolerans TaxID=1368476 RepID=A0A3M8H9I1_9BACI|nr:hypothetical protein [Lysinibacillus halotolerans]RNC99081.1 hypothetical protein EC501_08780 [Lysinibacillus halotolerans]